MAAYRGLVRASLSRFLTRPTVIELTAAVAVGLAFVYAVQAVFRGLVATPITEGSGPDDFAFRTGYVAIWHRVFNWLDPLVAVAVLAVVVAIVGVVVHRTREYFVDDDGFMECPHCLSAVLDGATVCCFCTRDIDSRATEHSHGHVGD